MWIVSVAMGAMVWSRVVVGERDAERLEAT